MAGEQLPGMGFGPSDPAPMVSTASASAQVAAILRREIQRGDHAPQARLRQRDVAARLGVSTTPVREAFQSLQAEGFLVVENHRGAIVVQPSISDIEEGYAIRTALESLAIRTAASNLDPATDGVELRELLEDMREARNKDKWAALDQEYHHRLNRLARMPKLLSLIDSLRSGVAFYIESAYEDHTQRQQADADHLVLLDACSRHDADAAEHAIRDHLSHTASAVINSITRSRPPG